MNIRKAFPRRPLQRLACLAIVMAGIHLAAPVLAPLLLAVFLALVLEPLIRLLARCGLPRPASVGLLSAGLLLALLFTLAKILAVMPEIRQMSGPMRMLLADRLDAMLVPLAHAGIPLTPQSAMAFIDPGRMLDMAAGALGRVPGMLSKALAVVLLVGFILLEAPSLTAKCRLLPPPGREVMREGVVCVTRYLALKTLISVVSGLAVYGALLALQVKFAFIWGMLALMLNFIPVVGSAIAAVPPLLQTFAFQGPGAGAWVLGAFLLINVIFGCLLEPVLMGRRLDLSTCAVMLSLLVWDGLLGVTGALLAVPLTLAVKLALERSQGGGKLALLMAGKT